MLISNFPDYTREEMLRAFEAGVRDYMKRPCGVFMIGSARYAKLVDGEARSDA